MSKIIDTISYNGEADLLELRLDILDDLVDEFVIVEASSTFSGKTKPLYYQQQQERFKKWRHKIKYWVVDENYSDEELREARESKYTGGAGRWMREYLQKEAIQKAITYLQDDDICYIGDVDEIWTPCSEEGIRKLKLRVYVYYLNFLSTEEFWGPIKCQYKDIKGKCLNDIRNDISLRTTEYYGSHFTNQGGLEVVKQKIIDQYNPELFNDNLLTTLPEVFGKEDFIGRPMDFEVNEAWLPQYLKDNKEKYLQWMK